MKKVLSIILAMIVSLVFTAGIAYAANPKIKIDINGQSVKAVVTQGETVKVNVKIYPGSKKERAANYFLWAKSGDDFYYIQPDHATWDYGLDIEEDGSLPKNNLSSQQTIVVDLPPGDYVIFLGFFADSSIYYGSMSLHVSEGVLSGQCGDADSGTFNSQPTTDLCSAGTPSQISGTGPWYWSCVGQNGGTTACCSANKSNPTPVVNGVCGIANGQTFETAPTANLCSFGNPSGIVVLSNDFAWQCNGINGGTTVDCSAHKFIPAPINGDCGSANGSVFDTKPTTNLCSVGTPSSVTGCGPWSWTCAGQNGGAPESCIAYKTSPPPVNGICGSANGGTFNAKPATNLCSVGSSTSVTGSGPWNWTCLGTNGGTTASCSANKIVPTPPVNGICGSANGSTFSSAPTTNLCSVGNVGAVTGSGPWIWACLGTNGGTTASCSANKESLVPAGTVGDNWVRFKIEAGVLKSIYFNLAQVKANTTISNSIAHPFQFGTYNEWTVSGMLIHNADWGYINVNLGMPIQVRFTYGGDNTGSQSGWSWVTNLTGSAYFKPATNDFCVYVPDNGTGTVTTCP